MDGIPQQLPKTTLTNQIKIGAREEIKFGIRLITSKPTIFHQHQQ